MEEASTGRTYQAPPLPHVVWRCIASHLSDDIPTLFHLAAFSSDLREICRPHISTSFETILRPISPLPEDFYYHRLVQLILEGYLDPSYIFEAFWCARYANKGRAVTTPPRNFFNDTLRPRGEITGKEMLRVDPLLEEAVRASTFIPTDLKSEVCARFRYGDPDAAITILLLFCTKLKTLEIPERSDLCATVVQNIAQKHQRRNIDAEDARQKAWDAMLRDRAPKGTHTRPPNDSLPFSELLVLTITDKWAMGFTQDFYEMIAFIGLPSLHRIILQAVRDNHLNCWPTGLAGCSCPEIYFQQSSVSRRAVLAFAGGMTGQCEIKQFYEWDAFFMDREEEDGPTWDRVLVDYDAVGKRSVQCRLDNEGYSPGIQYAWCSWLVHGKMADWRRLDEEFNREEVDDKLHILTRYNNVM